MPACRSFFFNHPATTEIYTLSLHDALPICPYVAKTITANIFATPFTDRFGDVQVQGPRSEEHTSELQSPDHLVCRLLLEKKNSIANNATEKLIEQTALARMQTHAVFIILSR